ncbi:hypothetical protein FRB96_000931 [Tulasnella sp. 330]|nr:hypothetical protein FRB96_000931 [Tulasnella sp. 330]KAG8872621.1 hypothetical protein FRB97_007485 [Tulasnella sp. 331]KAG8877196.1 hypothetical protein FRB98_006835 [Tulasnella sp. 332]
MTPRLSTAFLLALSATAQAVPQVFDPANAICLGPIYTGTPPYTYASTRGTAVTGLELANSSGNAVLQATGYNQRMSLDDSQISVYDGSCSPYNLNIGPAISGVPYRALTWSFTENDTPSWSAAYSEMIQLTTAMGVAVPAPFLACPSDTEGVWALDLLTAPSDIQLPDGCVTTHLKISANGLVTP